MPQEQPLTNQQAFDLIVAHLRQQNKAAWEDGNCRYRTSDGLKCAAGCLIYDDEYSEWMEGTVISDFFLLDEYHSFPCYWRLHLCVDLIGDMQHVHDTSVLEDWESKFAKIADKYNLIYSPK